MSPDREPGGTMIRLDPSQEPTAVFRVTALPGKTFFR